MRARSVLAPLLAATCLVGACVFPDLDASDKTCPCAAPLVCDQARSRCVASLDDGGGGTEGGRDADPTTDGSTTDGSTDGSTTPESGTDGGPTTVAYLVMGAAAGPSDAPRDTVFRARIQADGTLGAWAASTFPAAMRDAPFTGNLKNVFSVGGSSSSNLNAVRSAKLLDAAGTLSSWFSQTNLPAAQNTPVIASGDLLVSAGGSGGTAATASIATTIDASGATGAWTATTSALPGGIRNHAMAAAGPFVYTLGGATAAGATPPSVTVTYVARVTGGALGAWSVANRPLATARKYHCATSDGTRLYLVGGDGAGGPVTAVEFATADAAGILSPWATTTTPTGTPSGCVAYGGRLYVAGGGSDVVQVATIQGDGSLSAWTATTPLPEVRTGAPLAVLLAP